MSILSFNVDLIRKLLIEKYIYDPDTGSFTSRKSGRVMKKPIDPLEYPKVSAGYGGAIGAHRAAWLMIYGYLPPRHQVIDHINGDRHDNRLENLQIMSTRGNLSKGKTGGSILSANFKLHVDDYIMETPYPVLVPRGESCYTSLRW